ncbi:MAG: long-chain fatty acid--CoA ligase [Rhodocyclaceae bacterium]|nr:long-chain fatty acid--CoA ligase [Rhodocyclaceae bacterium]
MIGLAEWFRRRALRTPDRAVLTFEGETWRWSEMQQRIERLATVLAAGGLTPGERIAYLGFNHSMFLVALFATARIGAIFVPLNFRLTSHELDFLVNDAEVHTLLADADHRGLIDAVRASLPCRRYIGLGKAAAGWEDGDALMRSVAETSPAAQVAGDDVATILYTSGTTGRPKGAMLTHRNLWANNLNWMLTVNYNGDDTALTSAPLFHSGGLCVITLPTLMAGGHVVLQKHFDAGKFLDAIKRYRVTSIFAVPAMMLFASQHAGFADADLSSLRIIVAGGAPVPEPLLQIYSMRNIPVSQCWGMTETSTGATFLNTDEAISHLGSCGKAGVLNDVQLVDFSGRPLETPRTPGELCVRGDTVMKGYWKQPEATAAAQGPDGWFRTGDVAYRDEDGYYYICDRLKDMIISGGENVYPAEIESVLYDHAAIAEVAVIGAEDARWGERVVAVVALKPGATLTLEELQAFAGERLARYKLPKELRVVPALPRNTSGKVIKSELRTAPTD